MGDCNTLAPTFGKHSVHVLNNLHFFNTCTFQASVKFSRSHHNSLILFMHVLHCAEAQCWRRLCVRGTYVLLVACANVCT